MGYVVGKDYYLCYSPGRVDPSNKKYNTKNKPKVIGGVTRQCFELGYLLYSSVINTVVPVSSTKVDEMVKLLENTFRAVNIGLVNELAMMCDGMGIDIWEVVDAAATKRGVTVASLGTRYKLFHWDNQALWGRKQGS